MDGAAPVAASDGAEGRPGIAELRGKGLMLAVETVQADGITPDAPASTRILEACRARGVLVGKGGLYGNVLRLAPPLTVTPEEIATFADAFAGAVAETYGKA